MTRKHTHACSIAAALNELGDRWTLLLIREAFYGARRFYEFQQNTGISKSLLSERLSQLVECGIFKRVDFADRGTNYAYELTDKGRALETVMVALQQWADVNIYGEGAEPVVLKEARTGQVLPDLKLTNADGGVLHFEDLIAVLGPGGDKRTERRLEAARQPPTLPATSEN